MRTIISTCLLVFFAISSVAQPPKKIKIILLGTFHFNQSLDSNSRLHSNLFSANRQKEVDEITTKLAAQHIDKVFVERTPKEQPFWDSLYKNYCKGVEPNTKRLNANEIVQLGFKTAKKLQLSSVQCVDFQPEDYSDSTFTTKYATEKLAKALWDTISAMSDSIRTNAPFFDKPYPTKRIKQDSLLQKSSLANYLITLNNPNNFAYYTYTDWNWLYSIGTKEEYAGVDFVANFWYGRNLRIYTNILRSVDYKKDNCYLLIYGSSHIPFIKHLFETNPYFEIVEVKDVLK